MMLLSKVFLIEFGVFVSVAMVLLARQVVRAWWPQRGRVSVEGAVLLTGAVATCGTYALEVTRARGGVMPALSGVWMLVFGASCGLHVAMKAVRVLTKR